MPELIKNGYVYIAQPPLYRIKKGKMELYLKDDQELENFFVNDLVEQSILVQKNGSSVKGKDLGTIFNSLINLDKLIGTLSAGNDSFYFLLEQATISNLFNIENFSSPKKSEETINYLLKRLNFRDEVWSAKIKDEISLIFSKNENKVTEEFVINIDEFDSINFSNLKKFSSLIQEYFLSPSTLKVNEDQFEIFSPKDFLSKGMNLSKKGMTVQRYKGLGEMNPDQLWETTLDPEYRSILQVNISDAQRADEIFEELMGDDVEKRKIFIQSNAQKVANLDV
tara:strand:+ start:19 stop:861 length:843 start_codon:yes stop_codon:yes gene_type:complete